MLRLGRNVSTVLVWALATNSLASAAAAADDNGREREGAQRYQLRWVREGGAESCVSGAALSRLLEQTLGSSSTAGEGMLIEGRVTPAEMPLRYLARVSFRDAASGELVGERELSTAEPSCAALTPSLLLVLAMSIDPNAARNGLPEAVTEELKRGRAEDVDVWPPAPPVVAKSLERPPELAAPPERDHQKPATPARESRVRLTAGVAVSSQIQPEIAPGLQIGAQIALLPGWSLSVAALGWLPRTVEPRNSYYMLDGGVDFHAVGLAPSLCRKLVGQVVRLDGCAGAHAALRWLKAESLQQQDNPVRAFIAPSLALQGSWQLTERWLVQAAVAVDAELDDQSFTYRDHAGDKHLLFEPGVLLGRGFLGVGAAL